MKKLGVYYLISSPLMSKVTGFTSDYLVVCAFMAVQISTIGSWLILIMIECIVCALVTFAISYYFGSRLGSDHDFERVLGIYGTCTGTVPSGVALVRMVDSQLRTQTTMELGMMNVAMMANSPVLILMTLVGLGTITMPVALGGIAISLIVYLILLKVTGSWKKTGFSLKKDYIAEN